MACRVWKDLRLQGRRPAKSFAGLAVDTPWAVLSSQDAFGASLWMSAGSSTASIDEATGCVGAKKKKTDRGKAARLLRWIGRSRQGALCRSEILVSFEEMLKSMTGLFNQMDENQVKDAVQQSRGGRPVTNAHAEEMFDALNKYGQDLIALAEAGKIDPVIGRDEEIGRVIRILSRRTLQC
ncbi:hypothetical protein PHYBOEH_005152 [Phytophthora boehmeriae]|uniref:Uncharacterized protein n=1 Tax=Phytophthora boehmeriae TaxID=109152 RepID=A0A8T1WMR5_9STRA|nr:hypothetical protein PHYBOEH_005152 [Phytophthora boehmeriae]